MTSKQMIYAVPDKLSSKRLKALLSDGMDVMVEVTDDTRRYYLDTFDWRLYRSGMGLEIEVRGGLCLLTWRELGSGELLLSRTVRTLPKSADDFSNAGQQPRLKQVLGRRRLLAHASLRGSTQRFLLLNDDEKTVMRVELRRDKVIPSDNSAHIQMQDLVYFFPYRGYDKIFSHRLRRIAKGAKLRPPNEDPLISVLGALDVTPGEYSGRPTFSFDPAQPSIDALAEILGRLLQIIRCNVKGAREDSDPEYLHDFLVAVRRIRCLISRFESVFPGERAKLLQRDLSWVEQEATRIRDLDIYISRFEDFRTGVDEEYREALNSLYSFLQGEKQKKLWQMRVALESSRYLRLIESMDHLLQGCKDADTLPPAASIAIDRAACNGIWSSYRVLVEAARGLPATPKPEQIYELHQISKHLGYQMDLFRSLFPSKRMERLIRAHDRLQRRLNRFRDIDLQYRRLQNYIARMTKAQAVREISIEAVKQLIADRKCEQRKARNRAATQIEHFTRKKSRKQFKSMFKRPFKGGAA
ncbi:MAG: CHAD domain-containing protein [Gammaproteobacteria bacterium]|nr:CHAD domain-containing protein [Gammaproteobacteria bacterium]